MTQPREYACAFTAVVQRIVLEGFRERITRRCAGYPDSEVRPESPAVTSHALTPLRRRITGLVDACRDAGADHRIRTEGVEGIVLQPRCLRWTRVRQVNLR